ncbi:MAG: transposase [Planctomycetota bacterium]
MPKRNRRKFTPEQKADAVRIARSSGNVASVARDLDLPPSCLYAWIKQAEIDEGGGGEGDLTTTEREELRKLRRQVKVLEQEREILKKATAFFAKEQDRPMR